MDAPEIRLREARRAAVEGPVRLRLDARSREIEGRLLDLSGTGMGLGAPITAPTGQELDFEIELDGVTTAGTGVVVWSRRARPDRDDAPNLGIRFTRLDASAQVRIGALIDRALARGRRPRRAATGATATPAERNASPSVETVTTSEGPPATVPGRTAPAVEAAPEVVPERRVADDAARAEGPGRLEAIEDGGLDEEPGRHWLRRRLPVLVLAAGALAVIAVLGGRLLEGDRSQPAPAVAASPSEAGSSRPQAAADREIAAEKRDQNGSGSVPAARDVELPRPGAPDREPAGGAMPRRAPEEPAREETAATTGDAAPAPGAAPPSAPRAAAPAVEVEPTGGRAHRILTIEAGEESGEEVVVLRADGPFRKEDVFAALIGPDPPRYLLRLSGIEQPRRPPDLEVGSALVLRVRTGLHRTAGGPQLHVVLDLTTRAVEHSWEIEGAILRVRLRPRTP